MENIKNTNIKMIAAVTLGIALMFLLVNSIVDKRLEKFESEARLNIANQETTLIVIAETTARNGADTVTESIVRDCTVDERSRFESLLNRLNNPLNRTELLELERLFGRCGSFYSERKSLMVSRLSREIEVYEVYIRQLSKIINKDLADSYQVPKWNQLAEAETKQSQLFTQLVNLQDRIITTLLDGKSQTSVEISEILKEVKEVQESLVYTNKQAELVRSELASL
jgi:hypothetical protein